jgi:hypothetical protein
MYNTKLSQKSSLKLIVFQFLKKTSYHQYFNYASVIWIYLMTDECPKNQYFFHQEHQRVNKELQVGEYP